MERSRIRQDHKVEDDARRALLISTSTGPSDGVQSVSAYAAELTRESPPSPIWRLRGLGGDGGNRTHVRDRAKGDVYECVRCSESRPRVADTGRVFGGQSA